MWFTPSATDSATNRRRVGTFIPTEFVSESVSFERKSFQTSTSITLSYVEYTPISQTPAKGVLFSCHGYADSTCWFLHKINLRFCQEGYHVIAVDLEGHGHSDGLGVYVQSFDRLVAGAHEVFSACQNRLQLRTNFLMGESMGGAVALWLVLKFNFPVTGVILAAPMCAIDKSLHPPASVVFMLRQLAKVAPTYPWVPSPDLLPLCWKDPKMVQLAEENPLRHRAWPRLQTAIELLKATDYIESRMNEVRVPLLIVHGAEDKVTKPSMSETLFDASESQDKSLLLYDGVWHGVFEEASTVWNDVLLWMASRCAE